MRPAMTDHPITLNVPEPLYDRAHRIAQETAQSIETILLSRLEKAFSEPLPTLPANEQAELDALPQLSDEALWTIAREQMPVDRQSRMEALMDANSSGSITDVEFDELSRLVDQGQRLM